MKILIVDNNITRKDWGAADLVRCAVLAPGAAVQVRRAPQEDLPESPGGFDRVILSGSLTSAVDEPGWVSRLQEFIRETIDRKIPVLGVCYGHQIVMRALGGPDFVGHAATPELGWLKVEPVAGSRILKGLPESFHTYSSHYDEVKRLPEGYRLAARSEACAIQAYESDQGHVYGIQFHPETNLEEAEEYFHEKEMKRDRRLILNRNRGRELYDPAVAETIFSNFAGCQG